MTRSFQTTTILYYTFFLPGVFIHELSYWLAAGIFNVHAKSSLQWPEAQEIAELDLSFVELDKNANPLRIALITLAPIITGLTIVWLIANNILNFSTFFTQISSGELDDIGMAIRDLTGTADFWLWTYLLFVISNTMIPKLTNLKGLRSVLVGIGIAAVILVVIGVGEPVVLRTLTGPVANALNLLSGTIIVIMFIDVLFVVGLGTIEALIERVTGHSAMFRRGKLVAMTRQEVIEARQRQARRDARAAQRGRTSQSAQHSSIYTLSFDIPGPPGEEPITQAETLIIDAPSTPALPRQDDRRAPDIIATGNQSTQKLATPAIKEIPAATDNTKDGKISTAHIPAKVATPAFKQAPPQVPDTHTDEASKVPKKTETSTKAKIGDINPSPSLPSREESAKDD